MIEKFSDYEGTQFLQEEGEFVFTVENAELKDSSKGTPMVVFEVKAPQGVSTIYHSLNPKARWSYNALIKACLNLDTPEKINAFECDYETIHHELVGKSFLGIVEAESYEKEIKKPNDDGTFSTSIEEKTAYKIIAYKPCNI